MKDFRQDEQENFICEECNLTFKNKSRLSRHISNDHFNIIKYFNKWIKGDDEGMCKICSNETTINIQKIYRGYKDTCSEYCHRQYTKKLMDDKCLVKYNINNPSKSKEIIEKRKLNNLIKYDVIHPMQLDENKSKLIKTNLKKYGTNCPLHSEIIKIKTENTNLERYGFVHHSKSENIKNKTKNTNLERYGVQYQFQRFDFMRECMMIKYNVEYCCQLPEFFEKQQMTALRKKQYKNTELYYQSSYELDFLDKYHEKFKNDLYRGLSFRYSFENKIKTYYSDFFIPSLNLIIEIKNIGLYLLRYDKCIAKEREVLNNNHNYILILEKDYTVFNNFINTNYL